MKTILVPTDFSKNAHNAFKYAMNMARSISAKLFLFHVHQPDILPDDNEDIPSSRDIERSIIRNLKSAERYVRSKSDLAVEYQYITGSPVDEIRICAEQNKADLIIIGLQGEGFFREKFIGTVATALINKSKCPVIIINQNVKFKIIKNIALAFDYSEIKDKSSLAPVRLIATRFKSHLFIFNVVKSQLQVVSSVSKAIEGMRLTHALENTEHSFHYCENEDIVDGINTFVTEKNIDLVVMIPHKHSPLHCLFNESQTKKMAFHTKIPLMSLGESQLSK